MHRAGSNATKSQELGPVVAGIQSDYLRGGRERDT